MACLEHGMTVLCEKPPALNLAELDAIIAAERADGPLRDLFQHRFGSGGLALADLLAAGRARAADDRGLRHPVVPPGRATSPSPWRGRWEAEGGGPTMGHGIHQMDLMLSILGPWREVVAVAARRARPTATEDLSAAIVTFESGAVATVVNSLLSPRETSYLRFDLSYATVELAHLYGYGDADWTVTAAPGYEERGPRPGTAGPTGRASGHRAQFGAVLRRAGGRVRRHR